MAAKFASKCAIVIGAGIGGLAATIALSRHFSKVLLVEKDGPSDKLELRKALPQGGHMHALLQAGSEGLERLMPGLTEKMVESGGLRLRARPQWQTFTKGHWLPPLDTGVSVMSQTRPHLEHVLYKAICDLPNVVSVNAKVSSLLLDESRSVAGVWIKRPGASEEILSSDLVVDATGRGDEGDRWLEALGFEHPPMETSFPDVRYVTGMFTRTMKADESPAGWLNLASPPAKLGAVMAPVEQDRWIVTATIRDGDSAPANEAELRAYLLGLADGKISNLLTKETSLVKIRNYQIARVRFKQFDRLSQPLPAGYLPLGDAVASFNPIYAQGMSVAVLQAEGLRDALAETAPLDGWQERLRQHYLARAMEPARWAWQLSVASDMEYSNFRGDLTPEIISLNKILARAFALSVRRPAIAQQVDQVVHLLASPRSLETLAHPPIEARKPATARAL
ncbi:putative epoxidase LasC [Pseudovibrio sp. W64]|uniref:FAD-dependent oxidoreductase n=1 Tax=Pseudovibrio sp. W64 TaxID=1735583 RepID=UPI0007AE5374|nr:FAD-binding protein [Pseudovibrio sp. W64]KZK81512.1 putative epoxidase LasC [Pseudovibrio sp. W64]